MHAIPLPDIGDLEDDVTFDLLLGTVTYSVSLMFNRRIGRWFYSVAGVQDNLAVGAPCPIPDQGLLIWSESPESRDLSAVRLYLLQQ